MADVFCNQCGHRNPIGANFCSSCGAPLEPDGGDRTTITFAVETSGGTGEHPAVDVEDVPEDGGMLVVTRGPNAGTRMALTKPVTTVGRHPDSDIFLDDITVSRRHAEVQRVPSGFLVRDVGSLNGTYLNRERVEESALRNEDELQVGKFRLVFFAGRDS